MAKHAQAIILSVLYHFVGLAFKELRVTLGPTHAHQTLNYIYLFIYLFGLVIQGFSNAVIFQYCLSWSSGLGFELKFFLVILINFQEMKDFNLMYLFLRWSLKLPSGKMFSRNTFYICFTM